MLKGEIIKQVTSSWSTFIQLPGLIIYLFMYSKRLRQQLFQRKEYMCSKIAFQCMIELLFFVQEFYNVRWWTIKDFYCWIWHSLWMEEKQIVGLWRWFFCLEFKECTETCQDYWWQNSSKTAYINKELRLSCVKWFVLEDL
jgi:hypothetical protein